MAFCLSALLVPARLQNCNSCNFKWRGDSIYLFLRKMFLYGRSSRQANNNWLRHCWSGPKILKMGAKDSKPSCITYEDAVKRSTMFTCSISLVVLFRILLFLIACTLFLIDDCLYQSVIQNLRDWEKRSKDCRQRMEQ